MIKKRKMYLIFIMTIMTVALIACKKKNQEGEDVIVDMITPEVTIKVTPVPTEVPATPTPEITETIVEDADEFISYEDAVRKIQNIIGERGYVMELQEDNYIIHEVAYYLVQISDSSSIIEPSVLIDKTTGELLCFLADGSTAPFTEFPLYPLPVPTSGGNVDSGEFTREDAIDLLAKMAPEELGLEHPFKEYTLEIDEYTTYIRGSEYYCISVFEKLDGLKKNRGRFYVSVDGAMIYKYDSMLDDFVEIVEP